MSYQYDIFLSYSRYPHNGEWVNNHFKPLLEVRLANALPYEPRIFFDRQDIRSGTNWTAALEAALRSSKLMVAVLSPPYFRSSYCKAEYRTMQARERSLGLGTTGRPNLLIHPVIYSDGRSFPPDVVVNQNWDFSQWAFPFEHYKESDDYLHLYQAVDEFAQHLANRLAAAPPFDAHFPFVEPDGENSWDPPTNFGNPHLGEDRGSVPSGDDRNEGQPGEESS